jgi:2-methylisocitrate lyase-like PEP mutase family enzyme
LTRPSLRKIHDAAPPLVVPLAHDALSARLIERAGFPAFNIGGSSLLAARHGLPDLGLAGMGEMAAAIADVVQSVSIPCLADADDGYGDVKNVVHTVETYHRIGVGGLLIEDQSRDSKRPGDKAALAVVPIEMIEQKLRAALDARPDADFAVIGRTDAAGAEGLDAALRRAERFLKLGVDGVFVAGLKTTADYERVGAAFKGQWNMTVMPEGRSVWHTPQELHGMGFSQVVYTNSLILRVTGALDQVLGQIKSLADGTAGTLGPAEALPLAAFEEAVRSRRWNEIAARAGRERA